MLIHHKTCGVDSDCAGGRTHRRLRAAVGEAFRHCAVLRVSQAVSEQVCPEPCRTVQSFIIRFRKLPNGQQVKKYAELIEFLMAKDPSIRALEMDFEGKNILLYYLGGDQHMLKDENLKYGVPLRDPSERKDLMCRGEAGPEQWWGLSSTKHPLHCRCKDDGDEADPSAFASGSTEK